MPLERDEHGVWTLEVNEADEENIGPMPPSYVEALPRYLSALDTAFERAKEVSEFNLLFSIFAIRGLQDAGWDPYETTTKAIGIIKEVHDGDIGGEASRHLGLWLYGHIMEASEPYEFLANLISVTTGGRFNNEHFPPRPNGAPLSPQIKINQLEEQAREAGLPNVIVPMRDAWDRDLRNAIFHADYSLYGPEVRTIRPPRIYTHDEITTLINRAMACHEAITILRTMIIKSYTTPTLIPGDPEFTRNPGERAMVIVREGYGAVGLKDAWTEEELGRGCIPYRLGRFTCEEMEMLDANRTLALLPEAVA